jgi:choline dehydrogenase
MRSMTPSQLSAFTRLAPALDWPDLQYQVQPMSPDAFGELLHPFGACNLNPVRAAMCASPRPIRRSHHPSAPMPSAPSTTATSPPSRLRLTRRIIAMPALAPYQPREFRPSVQSRSDKELARLEGDLVTTISHPVGTCRMGPADDQHAVVGTRLRLRDVHGLSLADASVMPHHHQRQHQLAHTHDRRVHRPLDAARDTAGHIESGKYRCRNARNCLHCADSQRRRLLGRR